jgi:predicted Zn-dependent protease
MPDTPPDSPSQMKIFVSHSHKDDAACHALVKTLRGAGADVWYDEHNMGSGKLMEVVERELRKRPVFVVILSPAALTSEWVRDESSWAYRLYKRDSKRIILPVLVESVQEDDIWLWLQDFRRIETPGVTPFPEEERIRRTLRVLTLTPQGEPPVTPTPQPGESLEGLLIQGNALLAQDQHAEALPFFEQAALRDPDNFEAWANLGYTLGELKRYAEALPAYERATTLDPNDVLAWDNKGGTFAALNRYDEALVAHDRALTLDPNDAPAWNNKGDTLREMGRYDEAMQAVERALALHHDDAYIWTTKGEILNDLRRYAEALPYLDTALSLDAQLIDAWQAKAVALRALGREAETQEAERRAKELGG